MNYFERKRSSLSQQIANYRIKSFIEFLQNISANFLWLLSVVLKTFKTLGHFLRLGLLALFLATLFKECIISWGCIFFLGYIFYRVIVGQFFPNCVISWAVFYVLGYIFSLSYFWLLFQSLLFLGLYYILWLFLRYIFVLGPVLFRKIFFLRPFSYCYLVLKPIFY